MKHRALAKTSEAKRRPRRVRDSRLGRSGYLDRAFWATRFQLQASLRRSMVVSQAVSGDRRTT
jgi:hypothetical protein